MHQNKVKVAVLEGDKIIEDLVTVSFMILTFLFSFKCNSVCQVEHKKSLQQK